MRVRRCGLNVRWEVETAAKAAYLAVGGAKGIGCMRMRSCGLLGGMYRSVPRAADI